MKFSEIVDNLNETLDIKEFQISNPNYEIKNLLTDSRNHFDPSDSLFFAIRTPGGNDGHNFIESLYERGLRNYVLEDLPECLKNKNDINYVLVPDSIKALSVVGKINRTNAGKIVAITGSRGKTTVKEILFRILEPKFNISRSPRSYNSKIGVPLSLWQIPPETDYAFIEAGISKKGEMASLANTILPEVVIFTNIGDAHSEGFSNIEDKAREKSLLAVPDSVKKVVYPFDDNYLRNALKCLESQKKLISWSSKDQSADLFIQSLPKKGEEDNQFNIEYSWRGENRKFQCNLEKDFDFENLAVTMAFLFSEGLPFETVEEGLKSLIRIGTRLNVSEGINGCSVVMDSYTSDLSSLIPALDFISRRKNAFQSKTLIISDLLFEGQSAQDTYKEIARIVNTNNITKFIGIGPSFTRFQHIFPEGFSFYKDTETYLKEFSPRDFNDEIILIKGSDKFNFEKIQEQLEARKHETVLEVNLDALLLNYNYFRSHLLSSTGIIAMVKASGYGAGSYEVAKTLQDAGAAYLAVAALDEGIDLRKNGITMPVMVMNPHSANYRALFNYNLEPVVYSFSMLDELLEEAKKYSFREYPVHIKLDTGMHRMGFLENEIPELINIISGVSNVKIASVFSHLATADCLDLDSFTYQQFDRFERMSSQIIAAVRYPVKRHILNSAGIIRFPEYQYDMVRLGIGLYGANTLPLDIEKPLAVVSTLRSVIICIREIEDEEAVGYARNGKIKKKSKIATVPIGYADGMNRKFGNGNIKVFLNNSFVPTIGNICMDAMMIDVTGVECKVGDSVEIFGNNVNLQDLADTIQTIPYEILTSVSPRVKRIYYRE